MEDGGPIFLYDAPDKIPHGWPGCGECILSIARLNDTSDKYLKTFTRDEQGGNPVQILNQTKPVDFPSTIWKNGDHWNFIGQGSRFTTKDKSFRSWTRVDDAFPGGHENGGQWWIPVPNQVSGAPPPAGSPNYMVNCGGGTTYRIGNYFPENESFVWDGTSVANLEHGQAGWWGAQGGAANNNRMMLIGWVSDFHGDAGPGINFLTRLTILREANWDVKTQSLVSNPVPELLGLRSGSLASEKVTLPTAATPHVVAQTGGGAAASSDTVLTFSGFSTSAPLTTVYACVLGNGTVGSGVGIQVQVVPGPNGTHTANIAAGACPVPHTAAALEALSAAQPIQLFDEAEVTVRVLADRSVADWFVQGGRWAATSAWPGSTPRQPADSSIIVWSSAPRVTAQVDVYGMGCGWLNPAYTENPTL